MFLVDFLMRKEWGKKIMLQEKKNYSLGDRSMDKMHSLTGFVEP